MANVCPGSIGGGESVALGLWEGLLNVADTNLDLSFVGPNQLLTQLPRKLFDQTRILSHPSARNRGLPNCLSSLFSSLRRPLGKFLRLALRKKGQGLPDQVPPRDPWLESQKADVIHFLFPHDLVQVSAKTVCTVHDLQHEHLPEFFTNDHINYRRKIYTSIARECDEIAAISAFTKKDFLEKYPLGQCRTHLIPWPAYAAKSPAKKHFDHLPGIPSDFLLFPAYSYGHKNHLGLLRALSLAQRKYEIRRPLVCTGGRSDFWRNVLAEMKHLSPRPEMIDLGYVAKEKLECLYQQSKIIVFPSLFEGMGLPLVEAFAFGKPVACSDIPPFREFGGEAPEFFDPKNPESMADCLARIWKGGGKPTEIIQSLIPKSPITSWGECASRYNEIYQRVHRSKKRISGEP